jgi:hypothetical protein
VDFAAADLEALTVEEKIVFTDGEGVFGSGGFCAESWCREANTENGS